MFVTIEIIYNQRQNCWHVALFNPLNFISFALVKLTYSPPSSQNNVEAWFHEP